MPKFKKEVFGVFGKLFGKKYYVVRTLTGYKCATIRAKDEIEACGKIAEMIRMNHLRNDYCYNAVPVRMYRK